jgi:hypothetical protein
MKSFRINEAISTSEFLSTVVRYEGAAMFMIMEQYVYLYPIDYSFCDGIMIEYSPIARDDWIQICIYTISNGSYAGAVPKPRC